MKTPRLALFAFLALAAAPFANAAPELPKWTVVEEGPRSWARVFFTVGKENVTLRCRYNECKPERKAVSNLYTIAPAGKPTPTKVTIYKMVPRSKLNPRYYTDGPYEKVPEVINANAQPYTSELSHYTLDNTGAALVVVQGNVKYPATTDISQAQFNSYDQMKVAPPAKMANDEAKPNAPAKPGAGAGNGRGSRTGSGVAGKLKWWCDPKTGNKYSAARGRKGSVKLPSESASCKKAGGSEVVADPSAGAKPGQIPSLSKNEIKWLDKIEAAEYEKKPADPKALDGHMETFRAKILKNMEPNDAGIARYRAAIKDPKATQATIDASLPKIWGGDNAAVVALHGPLTDIQLSDDEWKVFEKLPGATPETRPATVYATSRGFKDGKRGDETKFYEPNYDPIALHRSVMAARAELQKAGAANPVTTSPAGTEPGKPDMVNLTKEQRELLTQEELAKYEAQEKLAKDPKASAQTKEALYKLNAELKALIKDRKPYVQPKNAADFDKLADWQKKRFCDGLASPSAVAQGDQKNAFVGNVGEKGKTGLANQAAQEAPAPSQGDAAGGSWSESDKTDACNKFKGNVAIKPSAPAKPNGSKKEGAVANLTTGKDVENEAKKPNSWITAPLLTDAAKGALIGLVAGSLFGPIGLIAGPLIGAALFYGLSKGASVVKGDE